MPQRPEDQRVEEKGREDQIKERAHRIWQDQGEPHGRHDDHWRQAESELSMENGGERSIMADETAGSTSSIPAAGAAADAALGEITKSKRTTKTRATKA